MHTPIVYSPPPILISLKMAALSVSLRWLALTPLLTRVSAASRCPRSVGYVCVRIRDDGWDSYCTQQGPNISLTIHRGISHRTQYCMLVLFVSKQRRNTVSTLCFSRMFLCHPPIGRRSRIHAVPIADARREWQRSGRDGFDQCQCRHWRVRFQAEVF